ncbi:TIGR00730 family Rossman fold protein [Acidiferrimicrobium sp. IK]|uniref:LOG family protein n=1 Tax=Acidiferrimicrobium sp. IK TaxID=2871700 RepID=UPI0021CAFB49|nr:TIGR00730 family Rossman fold protein [Acidiferrimicrobium sp. IK]MCU4186065.1 TIGR00730 family Rossman fold protein [Acidiferrimicrobium sp. IK]
MARSEQIAGPVARQGGRRRLASSVVVHGRVCVFSGSSPGARPEYLAAAGALGGEVARRGMTLVYGGASVGLMGAVADAALAAGGRVIGVIPQVLVDREVAHGGLSELRVVASMHERKALMADLSDGFVALPGGLGTLEELAEVLTWSQLGLQHKPCGLLDVAGFWAPLLAFLDHAVEERFVRVEHRRLVLTAPEPASLLDAMAGWVPETVGKWVDRDRR